VISNWDFVAAILDLFSGQTPFRVTVKDRYEMKKKVRELKRKKGTAPPACQHRQQSDEDLSSAGSRSSQVLTGFNRPALRYYFPDSASNPGYAKGALAFGP
jgi:hypothetical protein